LSVFNRPSAKDNNFWGLRNHSNTIGSPYYFNFHFNDVGNCLCFGTMGSGKTTLIGFLLTQSLKFGGKRIVFDKDRGFEILVRALGGNYEILKPGINTGFNPCQLPDTRKQKFLNALFKRF
jgi:type IV secretion system protein VirB4